MDNSCNRQIGRHVYLVNVENKIWMQRFISEPRFNFDKPNQFKIASSANDTIEAVIEQTPIVNEGNNGTTNNNEGNTRLSIVANRTRSKQPIINQL